MKWTNEWLTSVKYFVALLLWAYIIYRAVFLSITQDEAHSYLLAKTDNWRQMAGTTNTHWLNTIFVRLVLLLPGSDAVWKLRLLSILSWVVYAWSAIRLSDMLKNRWLGFACFAALVLNPFILLYFSLERGYAPAFAFLLLSLYIASKRLRNNAFGPAEWVPVFLLAALASLANFSAFYFFMALAVLYVGYIILTRRLSQLFSPASRKLWFIIVSITVFTAVALFFVRSRNELYYGGTSLTASMLGSMLHGSFYFDEHYSRYQTEGVRYLLSMNVPVPFQYVALGLALGLIIAFFYVGFRFTRTGKLTFPFFTLSLLLLMLLINGLLHLFFDTPYLFSRTALVLYPVLIMALFGILDTGPEKKIWRNILSGSFLLLLVYNFYKSFSLRTFVEWPVQTHTEYTLDYLQKKGAKNVALNPWDYALLANYFSKAYPGRYTFDYSVLPETTDGQYKERKTFEQHDYVVMVPPYDSTLLKTWKVKAVLPYSKTVITEAP